MKITATTTERTVEFPGAADTSILASALSAGWELPYSCNRGGCETCRAAIVSGTVEPASDADGTALLCQVRPLGDVVVAPLRIAPRAGDASRRITAKVYRITWPADDVAIVQLRFSAGVRVKFVAGQYLNVCLPGEAPRSFSMANAPRQNDGVQLHVRIVPDGRFGGMLRAGLEPGTPVELELPFGDFHLRDDDPARPVLLVAGGTGFAPMQALLDDALSRQPERSFALYWGARDAGGLYALDAVRKWQRRFPNFRFVGVTSDSPAEGDLRGGLVHRAVFDDIATLADHDVYVCGAPAMVHAVRQDFTARGMRQDRCYADSFLTTADLQGSAVTQITS